jgi:glycosyltransferase involved in cell wall biosynthesis
LLAVVIPCYKVKAKILQVLSQIGDEVDSIYVIDDACPEQTGNFVTMQSSDPRIKVLFHQNNQGVGGAVITGYKAALADGASVIVKIDGDGQMDPKLINTIARPVVSGDADYSKGNRFDRLDNLFAMPKVRILGNAALSLWSKISTGYWRVTDPTNGFTAIHRSALESLNLDKVRKTYFFESDMLFRLSISNCVVTDVPMVAVYNDEVSNLRIHKVLLEFPWRHIVNFLKRIFYRYYLREWSVASFELPLGLALVSFGSWFGLTSFATASAAGLPTSAGQATTSAVALILGVQLLLSFLAYDIQSEPTKPLQRR